MPEFKFYLEGIISTTVTADDEASARDMIENGLFIAEIQEISSGGNDADLYEVDGKEVPEIEVEI